MKKTLLAMGITLAVLSIVLAGCDQPTDYKITESIQSIQGPANVTITPQTGALKLAWDLVTDASGYEIRRKVDGEVDARFVVLNPNLVPKYENEYWDAITDENILEDGKKYVYQVIAVSSSSTRAVGEVVQSGVTTKTTEAVPTGTFPAKGAATVVKAVSAVQATIAANGDVKVTWTSTNETPVKYVVESSETTPPDPIEEKYYDEDNVTEAGYYRVSVQAVWPEDYYAPSAVASLTPEQFYDIAVLDIGAPVNFDATRNNAFTGDTSVEITWGASVGVTGYILQKSVTPSIAFGAAAVATDFGPWTNLTATQTIDRTGGITVEDSVPIDVSAQYRVFAQYAAGTSKASDVESIGPGNAPLNQNASLAIATVTVRLDDGTTAAPTYLDTSLVDIQFQVTTHPNSGYTYTIERQKIGETNGVGNATKGDWEPVPGIPEKFPAAVGKITAGGTDGIAKYQYNPTPQRQKYDYRVITYQGQEQIGTSNASTLAAKGAVTITTISQTAASGAANAETRWYYVTPTNLTGATGGQLVSGESVYIYGRRDPNHPAPTPPDQSQPDDGTTLIGGGAATWYDGSTAYPWPTTPAGTLPSAGTGAGYYINGSAYFGTLTAEVK
jgi:hypothetical protein